MSRGGSRLVSKVVIGDRGIAGSKRTEASISGVVWVETSGSCSFAS